MCKNICLYTPRFQDLKSVHRKKNYREMREARLGDIVIVHVVDRFLYSIHAVHSLTLSMTNIEDQVSTKVVRKSPKLLDGHRSFFRFVFLNCFQRCIWPDRVVHRGEVKGLQTPPKSLMKWPNNNNLKRRCTIFEQRSHLKWNSVYATATR